MGGKFFGTDIGHSPLDAADQGGRHGELKPVKLAHTMAFMFETRYPQQLTKFAVERETLQDDYLEC